MNRLKGRSLRAGILTCILVATAGLAGCGQTGPLYLPTASDNSTAARIATAPSALTTPAPAIQSR